MNEPACSFNGYDSLGDEWYLCDGDRVTDWGPRLEKPADPNVGRCVEEDGTSWGWMTRSQCAERIYLYEPGGTGGGYWEHPKDTGICVVDFFYSDGPGAPGFPSGPCDMVDLADPACNYARFHVDLGFSEWNCDGDTYQGRFLSRDELEARASTGPGDPALGHCPDDYGGYWGLLTKEQCESRPWGPMWEPID